MSLAYRISAYNRKRKWAIFLDQMKPNPDTKILDAGFSEKEYSATDNYLEKHYQFPENITALGINPPEESLERYPKVKILKYGGKRFPFENKSFDLCWSNAVIEHVGNRTKQVQFLKEIKRVSNKAFVTTPNRRFPIEIHTRTPLLHYLPKPWFESYLKKSGKKWATGKYMNLLSLRDVKRLLDKAGIEDYEIIKNRFGGFTLDFIIIF